MSELAFSPSVVALVTAPAFGSPNNVVLLGVDEQKKHVIPAEKFKDGLVLMTQTESETLPLDLTNKCYLYGAPEGTYMIMAYDLVPGVFYHLQLNGYIAAASSANSVGMVIFDLTASNKILDQCREAGGLHRIDSVVIIGPKNTFFPMCFKVKYITASDEKTEVKNPQHTVKLHFNGEVPLLTCNFSPATEKTSMELRVNGMCYAHIDIPIGMRTVKMLLSDPDKKFGKYRFSDSNAWNLSYIDHLMIVCAPNFPSGNLTVNALTFNRIRRPHENVNLLDCEYSQPTYEFAI